MSKSLQKQMQDALTSYGGFKGVLLVDDACKIAQIYAIEQQIAVLQEIGRMMFFSDLASTNPDIVSTTTSTINSLQRQLKQLQEE